MRTCALFMITISLLCLALHTEAVEGVGFTDTSNGYCEGSYGKIKVGDTGFDDKRCERIICSKGTYKIQGCRVASIDPGSKNCKLVAHEDHYPNCCKQFVQCNSDSK